jgi:hypothetical protein
MLTQCEKLIGILPERRKNSERITEESIMNWGKKVSGSGVDVSEIFFIRVTVD